jgi:hypothetical protein
MAFQRLRLRCRLPTLTYLPWFVAVDPHARIRER